MKIAIPAEAKNLESQVNRSFGRTPYFVVVNSENMEFDVIDNQAMNAQGGAGIKAGQTIVDSGAEVVITFQCGQNAADVLTAAGIKFFKAIPGSVSENIEKYNKQELAELTDVHPGYHGRGGK